MAKLIEYKINTGKYNMDYDSFILEEAIKEQYKEPIIRFYGWSPACVSLGRNQTTNKINVEFCQNNNIDIVKRVTGGRGLLHDNEVTYSFVCPVEFLNAGESIIGSYKEISSAMIEGFKLLNINLTLGSKKQKDATHDYCMLLSTGADLCYENKKLIGSAQFRKQGYLLQHGSILFDYDKNRIENIFNEKSSDEDITFINRINTSLKREDIIDSMKEGFKKYFSISYCQI